MSALSRRVDPGFSRLIGSSTNHPYTEPNAPGFGSEIAAAIGSAPTVRSVAAGEVVYFEGDPAPHCFEIVRGAVKEYNTLEDGRRQVMDFFGPGDIFGVGESAERYATAEAVDDIVLRQYPCDEFLEAVASSADLSRRFLDVQMKRLRWAHRRLLMLGRMGALQRMAAFLLRLAEEVAPVDGSAASVIDIALSRQDVADHLGLTTETVCRSLTDLKRRGLIEMPSARRFRIRDQAGLTEICESGARLH